MAIPWITRHRKPHSQVRVNQGHPLARDIAFYYIETYGVSDNKAGFYDAVTGKITATSAGVTAQSSTDPIGGGRTSLLGTGTSTRITSTAPFTNPRSVQSSQASVFTRFKSVVKPIGARAAALTYGSSSTNRGAWVGVDTSGFVGGGIFSTGGMIAVVGSVDYTGQWVNAHAQGDGGTAGGCEVYVNGVSVGVGSGGTSADQTMVGTWLFRDASGYFRSFQGEIGLSVGWNRRLTPAEIRAFNADPWQILQPVLDVSYFSQDNGGAGVTGDVAYTEIQDSWALSGTAGVFATAAWTEIQDIWAVSASVRVDGSIAWTEIQDSWAISGTVSGGGVTGDVAWTEIQDTWAISGTMGVFGSAAWAEIQDSWAVTGSLGVYGTVAWTEIQDAWNVTATLGVYGLAAWIEIQDSWNASGTVSLPTNNGDIAWTERQDMWNLQGTSGAQGGHFIPLTEKQIREARKAERKQRQAIEAREQARRDDADSITADIRASLGPKPMGIKPTVNRVEPSIEPNDSDDEEDLEWLLLNA